MYYCAKFSWFISKQPKKQQLTSKKDVQIIKVSDFMFWLRRIGMLGVNHTQSFFCLLRDQCFDPTQCETSKTYSKLNTTCLQGHLREVPLRHAAYSDPYQLLISPPQAWRPQRVHLQEVELRRFESVKNQKESTRLTYGFDTGNVVLNNGRFMIFLWIVCRNRFPVRGVSDKFPNGFNSICTGGFPWTESRCYSVRQNVDANWVRPSKPARGVLVEKHSEQTSTWVVRKTGDGYVFTDSVSPFSAQLIGVPNLCRNCSVSCRVGRMAMFLFKGFWQWASARSRGLGQ